MADYEVLELLLGYGLTRKDTKPLAKELIQKFGSIRGALDARPEELLQVPGFGPGLQMLSDHGKGWFPGKSCILL